MAVFCAILRSCAILTGDRRFVVAMRCAARESVSWRVVVGVVFLIVFLVSSSSFVSSLGEGSGSTNCPGVSRSV